MRRRLLSAARIIIAYHGFPTRATGAGSARPPHRLVRYGRDRPIAGTARLTRQTGSLFRRHRQELAEFVTVPDPVPAVASDPDDNIVVATAVTGGADVICTRDRHIRHAVVQAYCATFGIRVLTEVELLNELRGG